MTPLKVLKQAVKILNGCGGKYCLIGGHAASLYRSQERFTRDVDFALMADPLNLSRQMAEKVIKGLGFESVVGFIPAGPKERARRSVCMITAKPVKGEITGIIDIILPESPWVAKAIERAQHNLIDLGFSRVPVITPEDLVISKCYALNNQPDRFQDLDDLKQIFRGVKDLDRDYLEANLAALALEVPEAVRAG